MSIFSKAKSKIKKYAKDVAGGAKIVASSIKNAAKKVGGKAQSGAALNFGGVTGKQIAPKKVEQPKVTLGSKTYTSAGLKAAGYDTPQKLSIALAQAKAQADAKNAPNSQTGLALTPGQNGGIITPPKRTGRGDGIIIPKADEPGSADQINNDIGLVNLNDSSRSSFSGTGSGAGTSGGIMGLGGSAVAGANAAIAGLETTNDLTLQQKMEEKRLAEESRKTEEKSSLLDMFKERQKEPTVQELREDYEKEFNIKGQVSEINSLTETLGKMETEVANQVAMANDKLGSMNFINNQVQQIQRNASPELNRLRADINFKTGILTQNQELIQQAISDATAQSRQRWEDEKWFREQNKDIINSISPEYKRALDQYDKELERAYQEDIAEKEWKRDMIIEYGLKNSITDSVDVITRAASTKQGIRDATKGGGNDVEQDLREDVVSYKESVRLGEITEAEALAELRILYPTFSESKIRQIFSGTSSSSSSIYGSNPISLRGAEAGLDTSEISADIYNLLFK